MDEELIIDENNFDEHFFDVRQNSPQKGQVIACYSAAADFVRGNEKRNVIDLLRNTNKVEPCAQVMRKLLFASELDAYRVPRMMAEDMASGMTIDEVQDKDYKYKVEIYYYTNPENVPKDDPHWTIIELLNLDQHLGDEQVVEQDEEGNEIVATFKSKVTYPETKED
jgi:hypothetical protein